MTRAALDGAFKVPNLQSLPAASCLLVVGVAITPKTTRQLTHAAVPVLGGVAVPEAARLF